MPIPRLRCHKCFGQPNVPGMRAQPYWCAVGEGAPPTVTAPPPPVVLAPRASTAAAAATATVAPAPSGNSPLSAFGWRTIDGRVIQVEPMYMGTPDFRWGRLLIKLALYGAAIYYYGVVILLLRRCYTSRTGLAARAGLAPL